MGILVNSAYLMLYEFKRKKAFGTILQLGKQRIHFSYSTLKNIAKNLDFQLTDIGLNEADHTHMSDIEFFRSVGFDDVKAMEYGTSEGADYVWDLNTPVPTDWHEKFDFIYDGGTIEHVFHIPNCLDSICRMLKTQGRVAHEGGVSGTIDHGFFAIQPTLYHDFYKANGFETNLFTVSKLTLQTWMSHTGIQVPYEPGMYDYMKTWALEKDTFYVGVSFATKVKPYNDMIYPQQSLWSR